MVNEQYIYLVIGCKYLWKYKILTSFAFAQICFGRVLCSIKWLTQSEKIAYVFCVQQLYTKTGFYFWLPDEDPPEGGDGRVNKSSDLHIYLGFSLDLGRAAASQGKGKQNDTPFPFGRRPC